MRKAFALLFSVLMITAIFSSCGESGNTSNPASLASAASEVNTRYTFTDSLGREVTVHNPKRVVALMGSFAETWILAGGELVGVTDDAFDERDLGLAADIGVVGKYNAPNVEEIIALNPDFVILSSEKQAQQVALKESLAGAGINCAYFSVTYFEDYLAMLDTCTKITGRRDLYEKNGTDEDTAVKNLIAAVKDKEGPSVMFLITYSGGALVKDSDTMTGRMLKDLGCVNAADQNPSLLSEFSIEKIISEDPDFIFVVPMGNDDELAMKNLKQAIESNPAWNNLTAVKNKHYILLPKEKFLYKPNVRWGESYDYLSKIIYPE